MKRQFSWHMNSARKRVGIPPTIPKILIEQLDRIEATILIDSCCELNVYNYIMYLVGLLVWL